MSSDAQPAIPRIESRLLFHHVGVLVVSMHEARMQYARLFGEEHVSAVIEIDSQKVRVCFVRIGEGSFLELVESMDATSKVAGMLKRQTTYYHVGYKVDDIEKAVDEMQALNYKPGEYFFSEAFNGKRCIFLFSPQAHLIELIEA